MADDLTSALDQIRERARYAVTYDDWHEVGRDARRLLAAIEAVLALHKPEPETLYHACAVHVITKTLGDFDRFSKMDACPDCRKTVRDVCSHCDCPDDEWPCETCRAITAALTGAQQGEDGTNG